MTVTGRGRYGTAVHFAREEIQPDGLRVFGIPVTEDDTLPDNTVVMVSHNARGNVIDRVAIINIGKPRFSLRRWIGDLLVRAGEAIR